MAVQSLIPSKVAAALAAAFKARRAVMVHGEPGIGKSEVVGQVADKLFAPAYGCKVQKDGTVTCDAESAKKHGITTEPGGIVVEKPWLRDVRAALLDAVDLRGLPTVDGNGKAKWAVPDFLPQDKRGGVLFLDEINRGTEMVANACFSLVLDGRIGEYKLPDSWVVASAVNDVDGGARKMSGALRSRFVHVHQVANLQDVCTYANDKDWAPEVVAFLRFRPELLHKFNKDETVSPNPRAWEFISDLTKQAPRNSLGVWTEPEVALALFQGTVGEAAAGEYMAFVKLWQGLPSIDAILMDPTGTPVPNQPSTMYAVSSALARRVTDKNFAVVVKYIERMPVEYSACCVVDARRRTPSIQSTAAFTQYCVRHDKVFG